MMQQDAESEWHAYEHLSILFVKVWGPQSGTVQRKSELNHSSSDGAEPPVQARMKTGKTSAKNAAQSLPETLSGTALTNRDPL